MRWVSWAFAASAYETRRWVHGLCCEKFDEKFATLDAKMSDLKEEYKKVNARIDGEVEVQISSRRRQGDCLNRPAGGRCRSFVDRERLDISPPANRRKDDLTRLHACSSWVGEKSYQRAHGRLDEGWCCAFQDYETYPPS